MDRHRGGGGGRGDRYGSNPDSPQHYRNSGGRSRSSFDAPMNHNQRRSPTNYRESGFSGGVGFPGSVGRGGGIGGGGVPRHRPFDSPPRNPSSGGGFRPMNNEAGRGDGFESNYQVPILGQKRGFPFSGRGGGSPDHLDGGSFAKLFVGSVPRTATEEDVRPLFEEHGRVVEVALIKDKRTGQQQGALGLMGGTVSSYFVSVNFCFNFRDVWFGFQPFFCPLCQTWKMQDFKTSKHRPCTAVGNLDDK